MKVVVDANRLIAAMIRDGASRSLLRSPFLEHYTPSFSFSSIEKYRGDIILKAGISEEEFSLLIVMISRKVKVIPLDVYSIYLHVAINDLPDRGDVPFLALGIAIGADAIWTDDKHFQHQTKVKVFTTKELLEHLKKQKTPR